MLLAPKGNLITNGDFEEGEPGSPPEGWVSTNVALSGPELAFTGDRAALLGGPDPGQWAVLHQDVTVCPMRRYLLTFQAGAAGQSPPELIVQVRWLDSSGTDLGLGLHVHLLSRSLGPVECGVWNVQTHVTDCAPLGTCMARVVFTKGGGSGSSPIVLDAVTFAGIG